jgi:post-segregation antitoxin (ccd killing protein)
MGSLIMRETINRHNPHWTELKIESLLSISFNEESKKDKTVVWRIHNKEILAVASN